MIQIKKFRQDDNELSRITHEIRKKVFVEEQGVDPQLEYDEFEGVSTFYLLFYKGEPAGTGRWRDTGKGIKLERFAILPGFRNKGLGTELLKKVMSDLALESKVIYLHSQLKAISLYERYGFKKEGEMFVEAGIRHYKMIYKP